MKTRLVLWLTAILVLLSMTACAEDYPPSDYERATNASDVSDTESIIIDILPFESNTAEVTPEYESQNTDTKQASTEMVTEVEQELIISVAGGFEMILECGTEFVDPGVICPNDYYVRTAGKVNSNTIGEYQIKYSVYAPTGELMKELNRFVTVVDTQGPQYTEAEVNEIFAGFEYDTKLLLSDYWDNSTEKWRINISPDKLCFDTDGKQEFDITLSDTHGNETIVHKVIDVKLDIENLLVERFSKSKDCYFSQHDDGMGRLFTNVNFKSGPAISYFHESTLHYIETIQTTPWHHASIQISGYYGNFDKASITFHISAASGANSPYRVGEIIFDATQDYDTLSFDSFDHVFGEYELDQTEMLLVLNSNILDALNRFKTLMNEQVHLKLK